MEYSFYSLSVYQCLITIVWGRKGKAEPTHFDDVQQFSPVNAAVPIYIVELEIPSQLLIHLPFQDQAQGCHILHKVYVAVLKAEGEKLGEIQSWAGMLPVTFGRPHG